MVGLTITKADGTVSSSGEGTAQANEQASKEQGKLVLGRALHLTADGKVVEEDDVAGVTVLGGKGKAMTAAQIERYGLNDSHRLAVAPAAEPEPATEAATAPAPEPAKKPKVPKSKPIESKEPNA